MHFRLFSLIRPLFNTWRTKFTTLAIMSTFCVLRSLGGLFLLIFALRMVSGEHWIEDIPHSNDLATLDGNKTRKLKPMIRFSD